jgi:hypothetical protein
VSVASKRYSNPHAGLSVKPNRGLRSASIPVAAGNTVFGVHTITFTGTYRFDFFVPPALGSPPVLGSLIHGRQGSRGVSQEQTASGRAAYFNAGATDTKSTDDETVQGVYSPPDTAGQPVQVPIWANRLAASLFVMDADNNSNAFKLTLYRAANTLDQAYIGNPANQSIPIMQWGPVYGANTGKNAPIFNFDSVMIPSATSWWLELENITAPADQNVLMGDIFFHE